MDNFTERRKYQRCSGSICKAVISVNGGRQEEIELCDISAGGIKFASQSRYEENTSLTVSLTVYSLLSEFKMKIDGYIIRVERAKHGYAYSVKFDDISIYNQVQLDEIINSHINSINSNRHAAEDGIYTFMLVPKGRPPALKKVQR
ncbi:PilZ domain-containing protein [Anaerobacterium chartisolvens]|uniref:PilZ domain-containing protein n=1 Tax=Anaerobacterium chartisolvens TaxID=1297424 RepID=A0A369APG0_9FIRM|nr:PilZ domain-containing protein [Anaerobacterium chartisolvens]RCX11252.1 PilZ domain-containing protein [Anaerobacterium chartisolvens]